MRLKNRGKDVEGDQYDKKNRTIKGHKGPKRPLYSENNLCPFGPLITQLHSAYCDRNDKITPLVLIKFSSLCALETNHAS
jgi:hypothetical protein